MQSIILLLLSFASVAQELIAIHDDNKIQDVSIKMEPASQITKLLPDTEGIGGDNSKLGDSVAIDGNRALVGGKEVGGTGAVYVMEYDGANWNRTTILKPPNTQTYRRFGVKLALSGDTAMVVAEGYDIGAGGDHQFKSIFVYKFENRGFAHIPSEITLRYVNQTIVKATTC